jgi:hypothetical protein
MMKKNKKMARGVYVSLIAGASALSACSGVGVPPTKEIGNTEMTIRKAEESNAINYAPLELRFAQDNLKAAKAAMEQEEYDKARTLAEMALADATAAEAKSNAAKAQKFAQELQESIRALKAEVERMHSGEK